MNSLRRTVAMRATLLLTACLLLNGCICFWPGTVIIPDRGLDSAIRAELRMPFGCLTQADLLRVTELKASGLNIRSLEGLQFCSNLLTVDLSNNNIAGISPLTNLSNITYLDLSHNQISNIQALSGLFFLHTLNLEDNLRILDWSPLEANVSNGGFPEGGEVVVDEISALDVDGDPFPGFWQALQALNSAGVSVIVIPD